MSPAFSLVLPFRNQADHAASLLEEHSRILLKSGVDFEIVAVPNASTDGTEDVCRGAASRDRRVLCVENPKGGWGLSVRTGLDAASGQTLAFTNSARTAPALVLEVLRLYERDKPCLAKARRWNRGSPLRSLGSTLYNLENRLLFGLRCLDVNGTPKIFSRESYTALKPRSEGDLLDLEILARARSIHLPVVDLPVEGFARHGGKSMTGFRSAWNMYAGALRLRWSLE